MTQIKQMSIPRIGTLREGDTVALRLFAGVIVQGKVLSDVTVVPLRSRYVPHKRDKARGVSSSRGRFVGNEFSVAVEYVDPRTRKTGNVHVTPMRRDMLVEVAE